MAHGEETPEVNSSSEEITVEQLEDAYELLFSKYKKMKRENKELKKKITEITLAHQFLMNLKV